MAEPDKTDKLAKGQKERQWAPNRFWYAFCMAATRTVFFRPMGGLKVLGRENVPMSGPLIITCIHLSEVDPPAVACSTLRQMRFFAKEELFKGFFGKAIRSVGAFPVRRGASDTEAIRKTLDFLEAGQAVLLFPEGTRGNGIRLGAMGRGADLLAKRSGAWVLPTALNGTQVIFPKGAKKFKRGRTQVAFGKPFRYEDVSGDRDAFGNRLQKEMLELAASIGLHLLPPEPAQPATDPEQAS